MLSSNERCGCCPRPLIFPYFPIAWTTPRDATALAAIRGDVSAGHPGVLGTAKRMGGFELACFYRAVSEVKTGGVASADFIADFVAPNPMAIASPSDPGA